MDYLEIYKKLDFLPDSIRVQYTNFIKKHLKNSSNEPILEHLIARIKSDEPIEYILNIAEFYGFEFYVDKRVLIPRVETEKIVMIALDQILKSNDNYTVIDIGTGSGCIILSIAKVLNDLKTYQIDKIRFIGIEKSPLAYEVAKINRKRLSLEPTVELINIDFEKFDFNNYENLIILANLPYIPNSRNLQSSVINFEPKEALFGGQKGDEIIVKLKQKLTGLNNVKLLVLENDHGIVEKIEL